MVNFMFKKIKVFIFVHSLFTNIGYAMFKEDENMDENKLEIYEEKKNKSFKKLGLMFLVLAMLISLGVGYQYGKISGEDALQAREVENKVSIEKAETILNPLTSLTGSETSDTVAIVQKVASSVVAITSTVEQSNFYNIYETENKGSGVVYDITPDKIYIITNHHVIDQAKKVMIEFQDGVTGEATLIGSDSETDLALVAVETKSLPTENKMTLSQMTIGDSENLLLGEDVIALGNALGYGQSVTTGVVSALNRSLNLLEGDLALIQTDAAINPGNSGGALVNGKGELIGINTAKISSADVEGVGFAIPIHEVLPIIEALEDKGYVSRPYLGIYGKNVDENISDLYQLPIGVIVMDLIEGSGADEAGLEKGDVIVKLDDQMILTMEDLTEGLKTYEVNDVVKLAIIREGERKVLEVTLKEKE